MARSYTVVGDRTSGDLHEGGAAAEHKAAWVEDVALGMAQPMPVPPAQLLDNLAVALKWSGQFLDDANHEGAASGGVANPAAFPADTKNSSTCGSDGDVLSTCASEKGSCVSDSEYIQSTMASPNSRHSFGRAEPTAMVAAFDTPSTQGAAAYKPIPSSPCPSDTANRCQAHNSCDTRLAHRALPLPAKVVPEYVTGGAMPVFAPGAPVKKRLLFDDYSVRWAGRMFDPRRPIYQELSDFLVAQRLGC